MADTAILPSSGKRQSTAEEEIDAKKLKRGESEEEKEKRVTEMIHKFKAEYNEDEKDLDVIRDLISKYKVAYAGEGLWDNLVEYILDHLPAVVKNRDGSDEEALEYTGEDLKIAREERLYTKLYPDPEGSVSPKPRLEVLSDWEGSPIPEPLSVSRNDPLPEGYVWGSYDSLNPNRKDYIYKLFCMFCFKAHREEDCPHKDDPLYHHDIFEFGF